MVVTFIPVAGMKITGDDMTFRGRQMGHCSIPSPSSAVEAAAMGGAALQAKARAPPGTNCRPSGLWA
jgi:hypothetical protein